MQADMNSIPEAHLAGGTGIPPSVNSIMLIAPDGRSVIAESQQKIKEVSLRLYHDDKGRPKILPPYAEHDEYVFRKQHTPRHGLHDLTITFPLIQNLVFASY